MAVAATSSLTKFFSFLSISKSLSIIHNSVSLNFQHLPKSGPAPLIATMDSVTSSSPKETAVFLRIKLLAREAAVISFLKQTQMRLNWLECGNFRILEFLLHDGCMVCFLSFSRQPNSGFRCQLLKQVPLSKVQSKP